MNKQSGLDEIYDRLNKSIDRISEALSNLQAQKTATVKKTTATDNLAPTQPQVSKPDAATTEQFETVVDSVNNNMRDVQIMRRLTQGYQLVSQQANQFNPSAMSDLTFQRTAKPANVAINPFKSQGGN